MEGVYNEDDLHRHDDHARWQILFNVNQGLCLQDVQCNNLKQFPSTCSHILAIRTRNGQHSNGSQSFATRRQTIEHLWHDKETVDELDVWLNDSKEGPYKVQIKTKTTNVFNEHAHHLEHLHQSKHHILVRNSWLVPHVAIGSTKDHGLVLTCGSKETTTLAFSKGECTLEHQHPICAKEWWRIGGA